MFRRQCYQDIGGYRLLHYGGDDSLAEITARMNGWQTRSFTEYVAVHHRPTGTGGGTRLLAGKYRQGLAEFSLGTHPLFMAAKSVRRLFIERPFILAGMARLAGFTQALITRPQREISPQAMKYVRTEQLRRLAVRARLCSAASVETTG
jgi:hypothetical protein